MSNPCTLCPRCCGVDRSLFTGRCGVSDSVKLARAALHFWEEPCVSGEQGSGTIFFSGCPAGLRSSARTTPSAQDILARRSASSGWHRFFWSCSSRAPTTSTWSLPDILFHRSSTLWTGCAISCTSRSSTTAADMKRCRPFGCWQAMSTSTCRTSSSIHRSVQRSTARLPITLQSPALRYRRCLTRPVPVQLDSRGIIQKGTIVRHMVMPDGVEDSMDILSWIAEHLPLDDILVSVMSQYTPFYRKYRLSRNQPPPAATGIRTGARLDGVHGHRKRLCPGALLC